MSVDFNSYQAKATDEKDTEKEEEIFIDLEDGPEEVKDEKMQNNNNNNNNFVETKREEWGVKCTNIVGSNILQVFPSSPSSAPIYKYIKTSTDIFLIYLVQ